MCIVKQYFVSFKTHTGISVHREISNAYNVSFQCTFYLGVKYNHVCIILLCISFILKSAREVFSPAMVSQQMCQFLHKNFDFFLVRNLI